MHLQPSPTVILDHYHNSKYPIDRRLSLDANLAVSVQSADVGLCGLIFAFASLIETLEAAFPARDISWIENHPLCYLFAGRIGRLSGKLVIDKVRWEEAMEWARRCNELALTQQ